MWRIIKLKKVWIPPLIILAVVVIVVYQSKQNAKPKYTTEAVAKQDLTQTVSVTGTVEAAEEIELNFKISGRLASLPVKVGDSVSRGVLLASLESSDARANVLVAEAQVQQYQAALDKIKAGAQLEDIAVYETAVEAAKTTLTNAQKAWSNTKIVQAQAVENAWAQLVGLAAEAVPKKSNVSTLTLTMGGAYTGQETGTYIIRLDNPVNLTYSVYGLEKISGNEGSRITPTPIGTRGLTIRFSSSGTFIAGDEWMVDIPNASNSSYTVYKTAYDAALTTQKQQVDSAEATVRAAEQSLAQAEAQLSYKKAPARSYDISSAEAQLTSAKASLLRARSDLFDRSIISPVIGTVTKINYQLGETTSVATPVMVLLSQGNYKIKVKVPEADVAKLVKDQLVDITLDAFGSDQHLTGHIAFIDPASTELTDVVYYEVTILFDNSDDRIKPGMTTNVDVNTGDRKNALVIPLRAVKYDSEFRPLVEVLQNQELIIREVTLGLKGDDGLVEVISGVQEGELVVTSKINGQ